MGFQEIIDRWRSEGQDAIADHVSTALATFRTSHPQVFENLNADDHIAPQRHEELLDQLRRVNPTDSESVASKVESFCRAHQGSGPRRETAQQADLGHVETRGQLTANLTSAAHWVSPFRRRGCSPELTVDHLLRLDLAGQHDWLRGVWLARYQMWSFFQPRAQTDPFRDVAKQSEELIRRLGLGHLAPPVELLLWTHRLRPDQEASVPTTFDAALSQFYRPGGKTRPLSGNGGLSEVVHPPITGEQLTRPIEPTV